VPVIYEPRLLGDLLLRSLSQALIMSEKNAAVNKKFDAMFPDKLRNEWLAMIRGWEEDKSKPNPFTHTEKGRLTHTVYVPVFTPT